MHDPVVPFDLMRMFVGTESALFYLEIVFRTCLIYLYALLMIRWVGSRGIAQMSTVEFLLVIALGSAVGDAMFYPEVPLLHAMLVITIVILINKGLDILIFRFSTVEKAIDGKTAQIILDGVIDVQTLRDRRLGRNELFQGLREQGFKNLGEIRKAYLETSGRFSVFRNSLPLPGLPIDPAWDIEPPIVFESGTKIVGQSNLSCCRCGKCLPDDTKTTPEACPNCKGQTWTFADTAK